MKKYLVMAAAVIFALSMMSASMLAAPALPEGAVVVFVGVADVTGDAVSDEVYLIGKRVQADADYMGEHGLFVIDGKSGEALTHWLGDVSAGYPGSIDFGRIDGDASEDMLINLPSGGSGGITTALPVSMAGGKAKVLADLYELNDGPRVDMAVRDGYKMTATYDGIEFVLDLLKGAVKDSDGIYEGIFDESGRKVGALSPVMDPVGWTELLDVNNDGVMELVTYRSVWAVFHANSVGYARSVWGWDDDALKPRFVSVKPNVVPDDYARYLSTLSGVEPAEAMKLAADKYISSFSAASPYWRYEAFLVYRGFASSVARAASSGLPSTNGADAATMQKVYVLADKLGSVGIGIFYVGEGTIEAVPDPKYQIAKFERYLPKDAVEYLLLEEVEVYDIWAMDGGLTIQLEEVGNRLHDWEYFLMSHPGSAFEQLAMQHYVSKLAAFMLGIDNTPNFSYSDGSINPGVIATLEKYAREYAGTSSAQTVRKAISIMKEGNGKLTQALIDRILDLIPKPTGTKTDN